MNFKTYSTYLLLLACAAACKAQRSGTVLDEVPGSELGPVYMLQRSIQEDLNLADQDEIKRELNVSGIIRANEEISYEWETFDGWYNNPAHPEWGGADFPLERRMHADYEDGVYEIIREEKRGNVLLISNITQHGLSGLQSSKRTALFTFFGQQVLEEMVDAQRPGCIPEYENINIPKCHPVYDPECQSERVIPFLRSRYDYSTGYNPNNPRNQLNEITPWFDGGLVYGTTKAWTDRIRAFQNGYLGVLDKSSSIDDQPISDMFPPRNDVGLPFTNPSPPANATLFPVNRFWVIGNPRGNENPFLLSMGILWYRVHQWWARQLYKTNKDRVLQNPEFGEDEWLFNRARQFTIATYQHIVYDEWLPLFIPQKFVNFSENRIPYDENPGYSAQFGNTGYNPAINPQVAHIFQSAAMRFLHTMVTPGIWRRQLDESDGGEINCKFGSTLSPDSEEPSQNYTNSFLSRIDNATITSYPSWKSIVERFGPDAIADNPMAEAIQLHLNSTLYNRNEAPTDANGDEYNYKMAADPAHFAIRTCNSYWNPQVTISETNVDPLYLGMSSQATEREDTIITPDLRGKVFGPLHFSRRDLMAVNMQRARDHGLPDFNTARAAYGLKRIESFDKLNPLYDIDPIITRNIEDLRDVYNNDINRCDIWACGLAESIPSDVEDPDLQLKTGPGELFSEVIFDQFMRIRHGDRFWWENYKENGLFNKAEFEMIQKLDLKQLLILTTHIRDGDISGKPFEINNDTVCPQPFQLSELYMDDCTELTEFDYYNNGSVYEVPIVWGAVFLFIAINIMVLFLMAAYNNYRRNKILASGRTSRSKKIDGTDVTRGDGEVLVFWELFAGDKKETRQVSFKFGPAKRMKLYIGGSVLREIDLRNQTQLIIQRPFDDDMHVTIKIPHEYDIVLHCQSVLDRTTFIDNLQSFLTDIGVGHTLEEHAKKDMLKAVYTKQDRQRLLENFFKSVFHEGAGGSAISLGETRSDILECELTQDEFADAMSLKKDSLFVEQMFQLIDKDGNGFISFREFADMIVIFARGNPEDKIKLMFDMYDIDRTGELHKDEFKKMLKAMMELVNATVSANQMDQLINQMFESAGFQNKQSLTLEDFNILLRDHKEELSSARLNVTTFDVPDVEVETKKTPVESTNSEAIPARYRARETAPARARRTIIRAYNRTTKGDPRSKDSQSSEPGPIFDIPIQTRSQTQNDFERKFAVFKRWMENYRLHIFYLIVFELIAVGIFIERAYTYAIEREHIGLRKIMGHGLTISRGAGSSMMFVYAILLLTMARNFITYLRETIFNYYIPFDSYITFHKIVALNGLFFTIMHAIGHGFNFYHISTQPADDLTCLFREVFHRSHTLPKFSYWVFLTMTGFTSILLTLVTVIIFVFATQYARRYTFQAFWYTHHLYVLFYLLTFLHGSGRLVQDPLFGNYFLGPGIIYAIDLMISFSRRKHEVAVVRADILPSQVIGIYFKRPITFDYRAGQWLKVASAAQNPGEFHSFTISSAPHEEYLSLHIRAVGPWTYNFREHYNPDNLRGQPFPKLYIDGPFGEGHQDWFRYEVAILVGGGIGVTPFASILKELVHRFNIGAHVECRKVFFIWVTRTQKQWEWFSEIIRDVEDADKNNLVESHIFITQFFDKFDLRTTMLYICERHFQKISGKSLFTGLRGITHFGRPDFNQFFDNLQEEYILLPKIGVFSCGPPGMTNGVEAACAATNRFEGPAFIHHYENF